MILIFNHSVNVARGALSDWEVLVIVENIYYDLQQIKLRSVVGEEPEDGYDH